MQERETVLRWWSAHSADEDFKVHVRRDIEYELMPSNKHIGTVKSLRQTGLVDTSHKEL